MWNQLEAQYGYPGLAALEQYMWRSHKETRCVECGDPGTAKQERSRVSLVQSIPFYWMCGDCAEYWRNKE